MAYCLRRVDNVRSSSRVAKQATSVWKRLSCAGVVPLYDAFVQNGGELFHPPSCIPFNTPPGPDSLSLNPPPPFLQPTALFFLQHFYPGAKSLRELYLDNTAGVMLPESTLWVYTTQLVSMLCSVHSSGLACRCLHATRVLLTGPNRCAKERCTLDLQHTHNLVCV